MTRGNSSGSAPTMLDFGESALRRLCWASGMRDIEPEVVDGYRILAESWGDRRTDEPPLWSTLTSDSTPLELSVVFSDEPVALRATVEALAVPPSPAAYWASARRLTSRLAEVYDLSPAWLRRIDALVAPDPARRPPMAAFHALIWSRHHRPEGKIYVWLGGSDPQSCSATCDEVLSLLGFPGQWRRIAEALDPGDVMSYLCLDLSASPSARVKLYAQHGGRLTEERLDRLDRLAKDMPSGDGPTLARLANRAAERSSWPSDASTRTRLQWRSNSRRFWSSGTYVSLVRGRTQPIDSVMHQIALTPRIRNDGEAREMIHEVMDAYAVSEASRAAYERCVEAFAGTVSAEQMYAHTYVSAQQGTDGTPRVVVYFNPQMYRSTFGLTNGDLDQARRFRGLPDREKTGRGPSHSQA
jgi:hypothetical protein